MSDTETKIEKLDGRVTKVENQVSNLETKFEMFMHEMNEFRTEMRDRDNQRVEDMREIRASIADMGKHVRNLTLTAMGAIGAMVVTVIVSLLKN